MHINIKATKVELTPALREYIEEKIGSLEKFLKRWDTADTLEIAVEVGRTSTHHHKGDVFRGEVNIKLPHALLRAENENTDVRIAIDVVRDTLQAEIIRYKEKHEKGA